MKCVLGLALVVVCLPASDLYSGTLEVCPTGCAYSTIQDAVAAASNGDEIVVAPGTYTSTQDGHVVNMPDQAVTLRSSDPTNPSVVNSTIIDGQNARRGLYCDSTTSTNTIIEGFTFVNGLGNSDGGGMLLDASITVRNCVFQNNSAGYAGGGLRISNCSASIEQCEFRNNTAVWGGGMSIAGAEANPSVADCRFVANQSQEGGCGGAVSAWLCNAVFDRCIFEDNLSNCGAAIFMATQGDAYWPHVASSVFCGNVGGHFSSDDWTDAGGNVFFELCDDCNDNGILDWHDIGEGSSLDCNEDLVPDECHIFVDCNSNGVLDLCDLYSGNSLDCDQDEVPDECQRVVGEFSQIVCGLNQVGKEGTPGTIYPENDMWIPLVGADSDIAFPSLVLMAAEVGQGRVIVDGGVLCGQLELYDNWELNLNVISYLTADGESIIGYTTGHNEYAPSTTDLESLASTVGIDMVPIPSPITEESLQQYTALIIADAKGQITEDEIDAIEHWVDDGGRLCLTGLGWVWDHYYDNTSMEEYPMNQLGHRFGARWLKKYNTNAFDSFYFDLNPMSVPESIERIMQMHDVYGSQLPSILETNPAQRDSFLEAHATLAIPTKNFAWDHPDRENVYQAYKALMEQWPDYYARWGSFDEEIESVSAWVRERAWLTWRDSLELTDEKKQEISDLGQLAGLRQSLFMKYNMLLLENDQLDIPEIQMIDDLCDLTPQGMLTLNSISAIDCLGGAPGIINLRGMGNGVNVFCMDVGQVSGNPFPSDVQPQASDGFVEVVAHEANHVVDVIAAKDEQWSERKMQLISDAGEESMNYLQSMIDDGYFVAAPQEFFASIANQWFVKSSVVMELGMTRFDQGRLDPINQALFFADTYSQGSSVTWFYTSDTTGMLTREPVLLLRDGNGRVDGFDHDGIRYDFVLDGDGRVQSYSSVSGITGGCCVDGICIPVHEDTCLIANGLYLGHGVVCDSEACFVCPGDIVLDNVVDLLDFTAFLIQFGQAGAGLSADLDGDQDVDIDDFSEFLINYGNDCNAPLRAAPAGGSKKSPSNER